MSLGKGDIATEEDEDEDKTKRKDARANKKKKKKAKAMAKEKAKEKGEGQKEEKKTFAKIVVPEDQKMSGWLSSIWANYKIINNLDMQ